MSSHRSKKSRFHRHKIATKSDQKSTNAQVSNGDISEDAMIFNINSESDYTESENEFSKEGKDQVYQN